MAAHWLLKAAHATIDIVLHHPDVTNAEVHGGTEGSQAMQHDADSLTWHCLGRRLPIGCWRGARRGIEIWYMRRC